jgi:hypothetical protein
MTYRNLKSPPAPYRHFGYTKRFMQHSCRFLPTGPQHTFVGGGVASANLIYIAAKYFFFLNFLLKVGAACVAPAVKGRTSAILLLVSVECQKVWCWPDLQLRNIYTTFCKNR